MTMRVILLILSFFYISYECHMNLCNALCSSSHPIVCLGFENIPAMLIGFIDIIYHFHCLEITVPVGWA